MKLKESRLPNPNHTRRRMRSTIRKLEINSEAEVQVSEDIIFGKAISDEFTLGNGVWRMEEIPKMRIPIHHFEKAGLLM